MQRYLKQSRYLLPIVLACTLLLSAQAISPSRAASPQSCGQWSIVPGPNNNVGQLTAVTAISATDVWAVGNGESLVSIHFDGTSWSIVALPTGLQGALYGMAAVSSTDVWAIGSLIDTQQNQQVALHWDGTSWSTVPIPNLGPFGGVLQGMTAIATNDVWAVGSEEDMNYHFNSLIEHWDGSAWSVVYHPQPPQGYQAFSSVSATSASDVWAVGTDVQHWDGAQWSEVPGPTSSFNLLAVQALSPANVWAVGWFIGLVRQHTEAASAHFDGVTWRKVATPAVKVHATLYGIAAKSGQDMWAVGFQSPLNRVEHPLTMHRAGGKWAIVSSPYLTDRDVLTGIAFVPGTTTFIAVGNTNGHMLIESYC